MNKSATLATLGLCILLLAGCARADPDSPSGKRHAAFEEVEDASEAIEGLFADGTPDQAALAEPVAILKAKAAVLPTLFPAGSGPGGEQPTEALADIWTKPEEFTKEMNSFTGAIAALDTAVTKGDMAAARSATADLGKTCKSCHTKFREE